MTGGHEGRASTIWTALAAGGLGVLGPVLATGGRLAWLAPALCLPAALGVGWLWRRLGHFPDRLNRPVAGVYYLWALVLLAESGLGYARRLQAAARWSSPWLFLLAAAALCLWLCRGKGTIGARTGRLLFLAVAAVLTVTLALSLPGLRWENLWPAEGDPLGLGAAVLLCLSLAGYGVYGLCLPGEPEGSRLWEVALCGLLAGVLLDLTGSFGAPLAAGREEPVLLLLEGVRVPGVFRHGEAALEGGLALADLTLMAALAYGCRSLWTRMAPGRSRWWGLLPPAGAILGAGLLPPEWAVPLAGRVVPAGNLILGVLVPAVVILMGNGRERERRGSTFSGNSLSESANVGAEGVSQKNFRKNEKKC